MKEFIEKLIGRLEELFCGEYDTEYIKKDEVLRTVNQLAEEYINTSTDISTDTSSGWIPCSERLPDKEGTYLVTLKKWETITFARFTDIKTNPHFNALVIAWMPLPQPYTEEQKELSTTWQQQTMNRFERVE